MCGHTRDLVIYSNFIESRSGVSEPQGVKIWPFPLLWLVAFTTACTAVQAVINNHFSDASSAQFHQLLNDFAGDGALNVLMQEFFLPNLLFFSFTAVTPSPIYTWL